MSLVVIVQRTDTHTVLHTAVRAAVATAKKRAQELGKIYASDVGALVTVWDGKTRVAFEEYTSSQPLGRYGNMLLCTT